MQIDECRMKPTTPRRRLCISFCILHSAVCIAFPGCTQPASPTTRPATLRERQDKALKDPMVYSPDMESTDVSGGDLSEFDRDGFRKDLKNVFNP